MVRGNRNPAGILVALRCFRSAQFIADYRRAIEINPRFANADGQRGLCLLGQGKEADAQRDFVCCFSLDESLKTSLERRMREVRREVAMKP